MQPEPKPTVASQSLGSSNNVYGGLGSDNNAVQPAGSTSLASQSLGSSNNVHGVNKAAPPIAAQSLGSSNNVYGGVGVGATQGAEDDVPSPGPLSPGGKNEEALLEVISLSWPSSQITLAFMSYA